MAYSPLPLAAVVIHITLISFKLSGATGVKVLVTLLVNLFLLKIITGLMLMKESAAYPPKEEASPKPASPKLAKPVDPYEQLKRSASSKNVRHVPEDNQNILLPNNGNQGQTTEPKISVEVISSYEDDQNLKNDKTDASLVLPQVTR